MTRPDTVEADGALVAAVAAGDRAALGRLYDRYCGRVTAVAERITGNKADAEEVLLAVFTEAWQRPYSPTDARCPAIILTLSARRLAINMLKRRETQRTPACGELSRSLDGALAALRPEDRDAVVLLVLDGFTSAEVADAAGAPVSTIRERLLRGLRQLAGRQCAR